MASYSEKKYLCLMLVNDKFDKKNHRQGARGAMEDALALKETLEQVCTCNVIVRQNLTAQEMLLCVQDCESIRIKTYSLALLFVYCSD